MKKTILVIMSCAALAICALGVYAGFRVKAYLEGGGGPAAAGYAGEALSAGDLGSRSPGPEDAAGDSAPGADAPLEDPLRSPAPEITKIRADTTIIYEYRHEDGQIDTSQEKAPYFLIGMTEEEMTRQFTEWRVTEFSGEKVVMRKEIPGKSGQYYVVGVKDGYIAVFYQTPVNGTNLKEITDTPVSALSPRERQKLEDGIEITGDAALARIMEDYGS